MKNVTRILIVGGLASSLFLFGCGTISPAPTPSPTATQVVTQLQGIDDETFLTIQSVDVEKLKETNPELATQFANLKNLKDLTPNERKAKFEELKAKYPDAFKNMPHMKRPPFDSGKMLEMLKKKNPELAAQLEALKNLSQEERKAKIEVLKKNNPNLFLPFKGFGKGHPEMLKEKNPELAKELKGLKDLTPEQKKAKFEELKAKYPDAFKRKTKK